MTPSTLGGENHPNGYGILAGSRDSLSATLTVDVLDTNNNPVTGKDGSMMTGLSGDIIELWNIDTRDYRAVNLKFNFDPDPTAFQPPSFTGSASVLAWGPGSTSRPSDRSKLTAVFGRPWAESR